MFGSFNGFYHFTVWQLQKEKCCVVVSPLIVSTTLPVLCGYYIRITLHMVLIVPIVPIVPNQDA